MATATATASTVLAGEVREKINPIHKSLQIERNKVHFYFLSVTFIYYKVIFSLLSFLTASFSFSPPRYSHYWIDIYIVNCHFFNIRNSMYANYHLLRCYCCYVVFIVDKFVVLCAVVPRDGIEYTIKLKEKIWLNGFKYLTDSVLNKRNK